MKRLAMTAIAASLAFASPAFADDAHHPEKAQEVKSVPARVPGQDIRRMQDNLKKMQSRLDRVARAKSDDELQLAMAEYMQTMQENMQMARGMQAGMVGCPMMGGGSMMGGGMGGGMGMMGRGGMGMGMMGDGVQPGAAPERMQMMEKRMDMMQMMMEQVMRRGDGMPMAPPVPTK